MSALIPVLMFVVGSICLIYSMFRHPSQPLLFAVRELRQELRGCAMGGDQMVRVSARRYDVMSRAMLNEVARWEGYRFDRYARNGDITFLAYSGDATDVPDV